MSETEQSAQRMSEDIPDYVSCVDDKYEALSLDGVQSRQANEECEESGLIDVRSEPEDFVCNYLVYAGLKRTLQTFHTESFELRSRGLLREIRTARVPDVHVQNRVVELYREDTELVMKMRAEAKERNMRYRRTLQEKERLAEELRRVRGVCVKYGEALRKLEDRYQISLKQKVLVGLQRDRALQQLKDKEVKLTVPHSVPLVRAKHKQEAPALQEEYVRPSYDLPVKVSGFHLRLTLQAHKLPVSCLALHPSQPTVASAGDDGVWKLWGLPDGDEQVVGQSQDDWISGCSFHPGGERLATGGGDGTVRLWDTKRAQCALTLPGHAHPVWDVCFRWDGAVLASCSLDRTVRLWDVRGARCRSTLRGHTASVSSVMFLSSSSTLLSSSADRTLSLWDTRYGACVLTLLGHRHPCSHAHAHGNTLASCDRRGSVRLWDMRTARTLNTVDLGPHACNRLCFHPLGSSLAVASNDGTVKQVILEDLQVSSLEGEQQAVQSVTYDTRGALLLSAGADGTLGVWS